MTTDTDGARISTGQMRRLHALLRDHGISGDKAVHDYLTRWLEEQEHDPIESRKDLPTLLAAQLIAELETAEVAHTIDASLAALRQPFPDQAVGKLPRSTCSECSKNRGTCDRHQAKGTCQVCGNWHNTQATIHIDFVGHADVTDRLLQVDPLWTWRPFTLDELQGVPPAFREGGMWIMLTVCGVSRPGFGDAVGGKGPKEAIGDALRNAAMRFGVALDLWAKGDREWAHAEKAGAETMHPDAAAPRQRQPDTAWHGPTTAELLSRIDADAGRVGTSYEQITAKLRRDLGDIGVEALDAIEPWLIQPAADAIHAHANKLVAERTDQPATDTPQETP